MTSVNSGRTTALTTPPVLTHWGVLCVYVAMATRTTGPGSVLVMCFTIIFNDLLIIYV